MHSQLHSQTLQALRAEIEAATTLQMALNRVALTVGPDSVSLWDGPRPEDVEELIADDDSISREAVLDLRGRTGLALSQRLKEVELAVAGRAAMEKLVRETLAIGTGGVVSQEGPPAGDVLGALARSGALRLDWAQQAVNHVREVMEPPVPRPTVAATPKSKGVAPVGKRPAKKVKVKAEVKKKPAPKKKKVAAKEKTAAKKKVAAKKKAAPKKTSSAKKKISSAKKKK